jgi:hypothetical protein
MPQITLLRFGERKKCELHVSQAIVAGLEVGT